MDETKWCIFREPRPGGLWVVCPPNSKKEYSLFPRWREAYAYARRRAELDYWQ